MKKVKFTGAGRVGTLWPRRMWSSGEILEVGDDVADELVKNPGFTIIQEKRQPTRKRMNP